MKCGRFLVKFDKYYDDYDHLFNIHKRYTGTTGQVTWKQPNTKCQQLFKNVQFPSLPWQILPLLYFFVFSHLFSRLCNLHYLSSASSSCLPHHPYEFDSKTISTPVLFTYSRTLIQTPRKKPTYSIHSIYRRHLSNWEEGGGCLSKPSTSPSKWKTELYQKRNKFYPEYARMTN
jgi:hypothetical protein